MTKLLSDTPYSEGGNVGDGLAVLCISWPLPLALKDTAQHPEIVNKYGVKLNPIDSRILASYEGFVAVTPDLIRYYAKSPSWDLKQSIALIAGVDPTSFSWDTLSSHAYTDYYIAALDRLRSQIEHEQACGRLYDQLRPLDVLKRAKKLGCDVPEELEQGVRDAHKHAKYDSGAGDKEATDDLARNSGHSNKEKKIANGKRSASKNMKRNILEIVRLFAEDKYGPNFMNQKAKGKRIVNDLKLEDSDRGVSAETVDRYLRIAMGYIDLEDLDDEPEND